MPKSTWKRSRQSSKMSYRFIIADEYKKCLKKFLKRHPDMLKRYAKAIGILEVDPFHPSLRLHKPQGNLEAYILL